MRGATPDPGPAPRYTRGPAERRRSRGELQHLRAARRRHRPRGDSRGRARAGGGGRALNRHMYCTFCGEEVLQDDAEYCRVCGRQLASGEGDSSRSDSETVSDSPRVNESGAGRSSASQYPTARRALPGFGVRFGAYLIDGGVALVIYLLVIVGVIGSERLVGMLYLHQVPNLADRWHMAAITYDSLWADKSAPGRPSRAAAMVEFSRGVPITQAVLDDFQRQEDARRPVTEISLGEGSAISVGDRLTGLGGPHPHRAGDRQRSREDQGR